MKNSAAQKQSQQQYSNDVAAAKMQRVWQIEDRDEARAYSENAAKSVYTDLVRDASKAGFNPLTALRAGGGVVQNVAAGFAPLSRQAPVRQAPHMGAMGDAVAGAGAQAASFLANFDPHADATREKTWALLDAQVRSLNASSGQIYPSPPSVQSVVPFERRTSGKAGQLSPGAARVPTVETPTMTNPYSVESGLEIHPTTPDAAAAEERYGDVLSNVFGVYNAARDLTVNVSRDLKRMYRTRKKVEQDEGWTKWIPGISWR